MSFLETRSTFQSSISITWSFSMTNSGSHIVLPQNTTNAAEREMGTKKTQTFPTAVNQKWPRPKLKHLQHQKIITSPTKNKKILQRRTWSSAFSPAGVLHRKAHQSWLWYERINTSQPLRRLPWASSLFPLVSAPSNILSTCPAAALI